MRVLVFILSAIHLWSPLVAQGKDAGSDAGEAIYKGLDPAFIVNLKGGKHHVRADLQVMARDADVIADVTHHMPAIRHVVIMLLTDQNMQDISSTKKRERLRKSALKAVQDVLSQETGRPGIEEVFFTEFVAQ